MEVENGPLEDVVLHFHVGKSECTCLFGRILCPCEFMFSSLVDQEMGDSEMVP